LGFGAAELRPPDLQSTTAEADAEPVPLFADQ
jgi:hypothetical protein